MCCLKKKGDGAKGANCGLPHLTSDAFTAKTKELLAKKENAAGNGSTNPKAKDNAKAKAKSKAKSDMRCVLVVLDIAALGIQDEHVVEHRTKNTTFNETPDVTMFDVGRNHATRLVSSKSSYEEGRDSIPHDKDVFALVRAIKRARQLHG